MVAGRIKSLEYLFLVILDCHGMSGAFFKTQKLMRFFTPKGKNRVCFLLFFPGKKDDIYIYIPKVVLFVFF